MRNIPKLAAVLLAVLTLQACQSPAERRREDEQVCSGYGFRQGTNEFANCLQQESLARRYGNSAAWSIWPGGG